MFAARNDRLSLEAFRAAVGPALSDAELLALREQIYSLARVVLSCRVRSGLESPGDAEAIEERAAILEFDAGIPRAEADRIARSAGRNRRQ